MTGYFENKLNNVEEYRTDFAVDALEILEEALHEQKQSMRNYRVSTEADNKVEEELFWRICIEHDNVTKGLLAAYKIISNREVMMTSYHIQCEIDWLKETFEL